MEIISNAHACTREWTHEKSWHRENLAPSWNHPVSSISLSDPSQEKKKREMSYSWTSSCHPRQPRKWRGIEWEEVGPWNWKSDWRFFFFSFFRPLFTTRSLYIVVLPSIHIIETKFCTQTKGLYVIYTCPNVCFEKKSKKNSGLFIKAFCLPNGEIVFFGFLGMKFSGKKWQKREKVWKKWGGNLSAYFGTSSTTSSQRVDLTTTTIRRTVTLKKGRKKRKKERK